MSDSEAAPTRARRGRPPKDGHEGTRERLSMRLRYETVEAIEAMRDPARNESRSDTITRLIREADLGGRRAERMELPPAAERQHVKPHMSDATRKRLERLRAAWGLRSRSETLEEIVARS